MGRWRGREGGGDGVRINKVGREQGDTAGAVKLPALLSIRLRAS